MSYYNPATDEPYPGARLSIDVEQPPIDYEDGAMIRSVPGPRIRLIFEGETPLVKRIQEAVALTVQEIKAEIEAAEAERHST